MLYFNLFGGRSFRLGISSVDLISEILIRPGRPAEEILKVVDEEACDVIVLGTHSKGFLAQTLLGSVSKSVLQSSRKPVFLVPLPTGDTEIQLGLTGIESKPA